MKPTPTEDKLIVKVELNHRLHQQLKNVAQHTGEPMASLIRHEIREMVSRYPENIRNNPVKKF